jgi:hypothetical protein
MLQNLFFESFLQDLPRSPDFQGIIYFIQLNNPGQLASIYLLDDGLHGLGFAGVGFEVGPPFFIFL